MPGAVFVDLDTELAGPPGPEGATRCPTPARCRRCCAGPGCRQESRVVAYDDDTGAVAARAWWLLRWAGLPADRVAVLDGGFRAWTAEGLPGHRDAEPRPAPGDVVVRPGGMPVVDADGAAELARHGVLLDARAGARYRGETEPVDPGAGTSPERVNAPATEHLGPDGRWLPPDGARPALRGTGRRSRRRAYGPGERRRGGRCLLRLRRQRHRCRPGPGVRRAPPGCAARSRSTRVPGRSGPPTRTGPSRSEPSRERPFDRSRTSPRIA